MQAIPDDEFKTAPFVTINLAFRYTSYAQEVSGLFIKRIESVSQKAIRHEVHMAPDGTIDIRAQWQGATEAMPFGDAVLETLENRYGPLSGTFADHRVRSVSVGDRQWKFT